MFVKRTSKRALSLLLVLTMLMGLIPWSLVTFAEDTLLDSAIFCSDVHGSTSDLSATLSAVKDGGVVASSIGFVGDTSLTVSTTTSTVTNALGYTPEVLFSYAASHDTENSSDIATNWNKSGVAFENEYYYVYTIRETDMQNASDAATAAPAFTTWASTADTSKPVFIISHRPLHDRRDDNAGAATWYDAISAAAEKMDIVFFWGHNHTSESSVDTAAYYVAKDGSETFTVYNGDTVVPNFTYMNAGYINANNQNPKRINVATTVGIYADKMVFQDYDQSGEYTDSSYSHNVTVTYEFANLDSEPQLVTKTAFDQNDYISVTATTYDITGITVTNTSGDIDLDDVMTDYVTLDVALEGHTDGNSINYSVLLVDNMDITNLQVYHIDENGELIPIEYTISEDGNYIEFTTTYVGDFAYGAQTVPDGATLTAIRVTPPSTLKYFVGDSFDASDLVVTAVYDYNGEEWTRQVWWEEDPTYDIACDMNTVGKQTVTVTYCGFTDTFEIEVFRKVFPHEESGITATVTVHGATGITATDVHDDETVASVAGTLIDGDFTAYDIELAGYNQGEEVEIQYPIPSGVNASQFAVYHLAEDGTAEKMQGAVNGAGTKYVFTTDHFSVYFGGVTYEPTTADVDVTFTDTTTSTTEKTVYVLSSSIEAGKSYLIVNSNTAGSRYALANSSGSVASTGVTVKTGDVNGDGTTETYIELSDATDELWTVGSGYTFQNGSYYISYSQESDYGWSGITYTNSLALNQSAQNWSLGTNSLYANLITTTSWTGSNSYLDYYLTGGSSWSISTNSSSIYYYVPYTYDVTTESTTTTTLKGTYSIVGNPEQVDVVTKNSTTVELGSTLTFTPDSGTVTNEDVSTTATYELVSDPNGVVSGINGNVVTFTGGVYGTALVKVSYEKTVGENPYYVDNYIVLNAKSAYYTLNLHKATVNSENDDGTVNVTIGEEITQPVSIKSVTAGMTYSVWAVIKEYDGVLDENGEDGADLGDVEDGSIIWTCTNTRVATIDTHTGVITFTGEEGTIYVTAAYKVDEDTYVTDTITIQVSKSSYITPDDGTDDFPEYPNEGSVRFDKTATAVGNFSETGITQIELSMTGVPFTTGSEIDVVVMLDMTGSMSSNGMSAAEEATKAFVKAIVVNEDGSYNKNRVAVYAFNSGSSSPYELVALTTIESDEALATANSAIETASDKQTSGGTPFDDAAQKCYDVLKAAKTDGTGNNRQQFCVFMSDGGPTSYAIDDGDGTYTTAYGGNNGSGDVAITNYMTGYTSSSSSDWSFTLGSEYYTNLMKADGVTVYTVGLLLQTAPNNPAPYSSMTDSTYDSTTDTLTTIGSHYYFTSSILKQMASDESKYIDIFSVDNADNATAAFESIAVSILDAAKNVVVEDKISDDYTMVFEAPNSDVSAAVGSDQEFYIEVVEYALKAVTDSEGNVTDYQRDTETSLVRIYLKNTNGVYSAVDADGNAFATPAFAEVEDGVKGYWTTTAPGVDTVSVTGADGATYYFVSDGSGEYHMTSGVYAYGTLTEETIVSTDPSTGEVTTSTNTVCKDLVIVTPYFVYDAETRILVWTSESLKNTELALRYFLYLNNSAGWEEAEEQMVAGTYTTNDYAHLNYTNFKDVEVEQTFPVPQMTWNGAQVTYVFYLVNEAGQPVNRAGRVIPFSEAVYVTDAYTNAVVWNDLGEDRAFIASQLAKDLIPDVYQLYDEEARYDIHVYESNHTEVEEGDEAYADFITKYGYDSHFAIHGSDSVENKNTTYVFNTKADAVKYNAYGEYSADGWYFCAKRNEDGSESEFYGPHENTNTTENFDFANTTVAFAVVWKPQLEEDTVVVDYGIPVVVNVTQNDVLASGLVGVMASAPSGITINSGTYTSAKVTSISTDLYNASVESLTSVRFQLSTMNVTAPIVLYYESDVNYYSGTNLEQASMYSSLTVIPATTVYYEETFVEFEDSTATSDDASYGVWKADGTNDDSTVQATDRPGVYDILSASYDANNLYGYDQAYDYWSTFSNGGAMKVTVDATTGKNGVAPNASFTFTGTGFDIISLTDNDSGFIMVTVTDASGNTVAKKNVDNYYGYDYYEYYQTVYTYTATTETVDGEEVTTYAWVPVYTEITEDAYKAGTNGTKPAEPAVGDTYTEYGTGKWVVSTSSTDCIYQVPVIKIDNLTYGTYTVTIKVAYMSIADHVKDGSYSFWLDAIRVYDPVKGNTVAENAYNEDGETTPDYIVVKDIILDTDNLTSEGMINGAVFIDGIDSTNVAADYENPGPNNETYLANGQSVSFKLVANKEPAAIMIGAKLAYGTSATLKVGTEDFVTLKTATDMYYDLSDAITWTQNSSGMFESNALVLSNSSTTSVISITNLKAINAEFVVSTTASVATLSLDETETEEVTTVSVVVDEEVLTTAAFTLARLYTPAPEVEPFEPEYVATNWRAGKVGKASYLQVITSEDVESVTVEGKEITSYTRIPVIKFVRGKIQIEYCRVWVYTVKAKEAGTFTFNVVAYNADGVASEEIETELTVKAQNKK